MNPRHHRRHLPNRLILAFTVLASGQVQRSSPALRPKAERLAGEIQDLVAALYGDGEGPGRAGDLSREDRARLLGSTRGGIVLFEADRPARVLDHTDRLLAHVGAAAPPVRGGLGPPAVCRDPKDCERRIRNAGGTR